MITLYRTAQCEACDEVQDKLRELVVAHQVVDVAQERPAALADKELPAIVDGEQVVSGQTDVTDYLAGLTREVELWRKFQSDVCYIDDEGNTC